MSAYRYQTVYGHQLREGDEMRAADGESWIPLTRVEVPGPSNVRVRLWTRPRPAWDSPPDLEYYQSGRFRIRRPADYLRRNP